MSYAGRVAELSAARPELAAEVANFTGVSGVLQWMQARGLTRTQVDIVGMDEFESDFLIRLGGEGAEWIVFGVT